MDNETPVDPPVEQVDPGVNLDYINQQASQGGSNNQLPIILIVIGGVVFFLLLLIVVLSAMMGGGSKKTTKSKLSPTIKKTAKKVTPTSKEEDLIPTTQEELSPTTTKTHVVQEIIVGADGKIITPTTGEQPTTAPVTVKMTLTSSAFTAGGNIPLKYTCGGDDVNPPLTFNNIPSDTKALAIIVDDPDAASGRFAHWLVWNINPGNKELAENFLPQGAMEGVNDFDKSGYKGPCPPEKETHTYRFTVYALNSEIILDASAKLADLEAMIKSKTITQAELTGKYGRN